jgi:tRNA(Arg) A34 adenosine deaminase TadA
MGKVICIGETSIDENYDPTAHAEVNSIRQACTRHDPPFTLTFEFVLSNLLYFTLRI